MNNILEQLNWNWAKKYWCASNVMNAFWVKWLWNAYEWIKYIDKKDNPEIWDVIVMNRYNKYYKKSPIWTQDWYWYWHVAVITKIINNNIIEITDWPTSFTFKIDKKYIDWYITPKKMVELWSKITLINTNMNEWFYEKMFKQKYPNWSSVFNDLNWAKEKLWDVVFFLAIWLERVLEKK